MKFLKKDFFIETKATFEKGFTIYQLRKAFIITSLFSILFIVAPIRAICATGGVILVQRGFWPGLIPIFMFPITTLYNVFNTPGFSLGSTGFYTLLASTGIYSSIPLIYKVWQSGYMGNVFNWMNEMLSGDRYGKKNHAMLNASLTTMAGSRDLLNTIFLEILQNRGEIRRLETVIDEQAVRGRNHTLKCAVELNQILELKFKALTTIVEKAIADNSRESWSALNAELERISGEAKLSGGDKNTVVLDSDNNLPPKQEDPVLVGVPLDISNVEIALRELDLELGKPATQNLVLHDVQGELLVERDSNTNQNLNVLVEKENIIKTIISEEKKENSVVDESQIMELEQTFADKLKTQLIRGTLVIAMIEGGRTLLNVYLATKSLDYQIPPQVTAIFGAPLSLMASQVEFKQLAVVKQVNQLLLTTNSKVKTLSSMESKLFDLLKSNTGSEKVSMRSQTSVSQVVSLIELPSKTNLGQSRQIDFGTTRKLEFIDYKAKTLALMRVEYQRRDLENDWISIDTPKPKSVKYLKNFLKHE